MGNTTAPALSEDSDKFINVCLATSSASPAKNVGNTTASETDMRDPCGDKPHEMQSYLQDYRDNSQELMPKVKRTLDLLHSNVDGCVDRSAENALRGVEEKGEEIVWCPVHGFENVTAQSYCVYRKNTDFDARRPGCDSDAGKPAAGLVSLQVHDVIPPHDSGAVRKPNCDAKNPISDISPKSTAVNPHVHAVIGTVYSTGGYMRKGVNELDCGAQESSVYDTKRPTSDLQETSIQETSTRTVQTPYTNVVEKAECAISNKPKTAAVQPMASASTPTSDEVTAGNGLTEEEKEARKAISSANKKISKVKTKVEGTLKGVGAEEKKLDDTVQWMDKQKNTLEEAMTAHVRQLHANIDDQHQQARDAFNREQEKYWTRILEAKLDVQNYMSLLASMLAEIQDKYEEVKKRGLCATASVPAFCSQFQARLAKTPEIKMARPTYSLYLPEVTGEDIGSLVGSFRITENAPEKQPQPSQQKDAGKPKPGNTSVKGATAATQGGSKKKEKTAPPNVPAAEKKAETPAGKTKKKGDNPVGKKNAAVKTNSAPKPVPKEKVKAAVSKKSSIPATDSQTWNQKAGPSVDVSYNSLLRKGLAASPLSLSSLAASDSFPSKIATSPAPDVFAFLSRVSTNSTTIQAWASAQKGKAETIHSNTDAYKGKAANTATVSGTVSGKKETDCTYTSVASSESSAKQKHSTLGMASATALSTKGAGNSSDSRGKPALTTPAHAATGTGGCMHTGVNTRSLSHDDIAVSLAKKEKGSSLMESAASLDSLSARKGKRKRTKKKKQKESPSPGPYSMTVRTGAYPVKFQGRQKPVTGLAPRPDGKIWVVYGYCDPHLDLLDKDGKILKSTKIGKDPLHASCFDREHVLVASRSPSELRLFDSEGKLSQTIEEDIFSSGLSVGNTGIVVSSDKALYWICLDGGESRYIVPEQRSSRFKFCSTAIVPHQGKEIVCAADRQGKAVHFWRREDNGEFVPLPPLTEENITNQEASKRESFVPVSISSHSKGFLAILDVNENFSRVFIFNMALHRPVRVIAGSQICTGAGAVPSVLAFGAVRTEECPTIWVVTTTGSLCRTDLAFEYYN